MRLLYVVLGFLRIITSIAESHIEKKMRYRDQGFKRFGVLFWAVLVIRIQTFSCLYWDASI